MLVERFNVSGKNGLTLKGVRTIPKKQPKAVIQIFHGMGEHKERYLPFMQFMSEHGYACYAHDHRKHGESVAVEEGYGLFDENDRWDDVLDDGYFVSRKILKDYPGIKIIVMGHSMGSIIARMFVSRNALLPHAAIFMGTLPPISWGRAAVPKTLAAVIGLFSGKHKRSAFLADALNKPLLAKFENPRTKFDWLTHDDAIVDAYIEDPLCGYAYTARFYQEFFRAIREVTKSDVILKTKDNPILFISGEEDPVGDYGEGVREIYRTYNGHGYTQLTLKLIPDARHEVLNELNKDETFAYILGWCDNTLE
jgi:alpha-beta hydrolase superfamily lysophospholipase